MSRLELETTQSMPTLTCRQLAKTYQLGASSVSVLDGFSLTLYPGEIGMLMGPSGCGKTTLLMIAGGVLHPDRGDCIVRERNLFTMSPKEKVAFRASHISFIFQHLHLLPALSALDNLALPLLIDGVSKEEARAQARELMRRLGLELHMESSLDVLSGGQKQRIAMGRALIRAPSLILCDEPTSNLDIDSTEIVFSLIRDYAMQQGCTFLISTHDYRIMNYADTIVEFQGMNRYQLRTKDAA